MNEKIFEKKNYCVVGKIVPYEQFKIFCDNPDGFKIDPGHYPNIINRAEELAGKEYPMLIASDYMMYKRDGNRAIYELKYMERRQDILILALAEFVEQKNRFTDSIINLMWMILEETTWVIPAHNHPKKDVNTCLPYSFIEKVDFFDLFSAMTGACVALVYHLMKERFDSVTTIICDRIRCELNRRLIDPFLNDVDMIEHLWWSGSRGNRVNNWCPWIVSNVLTVCALTVKEKGRREAIVRRSLPLLDAFTATYHSDGGCDEGPSYFNVAGGALFNACEVLYDLTNGYINVYDDPLIKNMGEYAVKAIINGVRAMNFADSPSKVNINPVMMYLWGKRCNSEMMITYGQNRLDGELYDTVAQNGINMNLVYIPYRAFKFLCIPRLEKTDFIAPKKFYLDGIKIAATREYKDTSKGLYVAFKGGTNNEGHNHNDLGTTIVFADGNPIFLDAGSGTYTRRTFNEERYTIWSMLSDYHNCATINGVTQKQGTEYVTCDEFYDEQSGKLTMSLVNAYPEEAGIEEYYKSAVLENSTVIIEDKIKLKSPGKIKFSLICDCEPENVTDSSLTIHGRKVCYDETLEFKVEALDKTWPETANIPSHWDVETLYRITLTTREDIVEKDYLLTVK